MKKYILCLLFIFLIAGGYYYCQNLKLNTNSSVIYGNVDIHQVDLSFETQGRVTDILVKEGNLVKKGDILAKLDSTSLKLKRASAIDNLQSSQEKLNRLLNGNRAEEINMALQQYNQAKAKLSLAEINYNRNNNLYIKSNGKGISKAVVDESYSNLQQAKATLAYADQNYQLMKKGARDEDINLAKIEVNAAQHQIDIIDDEISKTVLKAPQDGVIRNKIIEIGDLVSSSKTSFTILLNQEKKVRAYIDLVNLSKIKYGQTVKILTDGLDHELEGVVSFISESSEFTPKNIETEELRSSLVYEIRIEVSDPNNFLHLGVPVTVSF